MVELTRAVVRGAFTGDLCGDFTGAHRSTDCEQKWITCNPGRGGCNYVSLRVNTGAVITVADYVLRITIPAMPK